MFSLFLKSRHVSYLPIVTLILTLRHSVVMSSNLGLNRVKTKDSNSCTYCCYVIHATFILVLGRREEGGGCINILIQAQLITMNSRAIKGLVVCNSCDLSALGPNIEV